MSNAVDILLIGGEHDGRVVCQQRPVPLTLDVNGAEYISGTATIVGVKYHVATKSGDPVPTPDAITNAVLLRGHVPAWDLNREVS